MPEVSVIINYYNGERYIREAIDSVYAQTYKDWEIILWDDASTDKNADIVKGYDERLRYFRGNKAVSLGQARNWAIEKAKGQFIAFLDQDDIWKSHKLEKQIPLFKNDSSVGLVFSDAIDFYENSGICLTHFRNIRVNPPKGQIFKYLFQITNYPISMPTAVIRTDAFNALEEKFNIKYSYAEEYDLFLRIAYSWKCDYIGEPLAIHRIHASNTTKIYHQKIAEELSLIINQLIQHYPELEDECKKEISINKRAIALQLGKSLWQDRKTKEARKILAQNLFYYKNMLAYLGTYFQYDHVMRIKDILDRLAKKS